MKKYDKIVLGDIMQWNRLDLLIGQENRKILHQKCILVLGVGGVGSSAVEHLVRNSIGKIILVDYDKVDITNLNRQIMTLHSNIGKYKVDVVEQRIKEISPQCQVEKKYEKITTDNIDLLFDEKIDFIIDACDTVSVKKELIRKSIQYQIPLISSMGTGNKLDPRKLEITDIKKTSYDPIAKIIRKMVREEKIKEKIMVISSKEKPMKIEKKIASWSFVPNTAGMLASYYVIEQLLKENHYESKKSTH